MKKKIKINYNYFTKYNRLFKFLAFDWRFLTCVFITLIILVTIFLIFQLRQAISIDKFPSTPPSF